MNTTVMEGSVDQKEESFSGQRADRLRAGVRGRGQGARKGQQRLFLKRMKDRVGSPSSEMDQHCPELEVRGVRLVAGTTRTAEHWSISRGREWRGKAGAEQKEHYISRLRSLGSILEAV